MPAVKPKLEDNIIGIADPSTPIYRIFTLERLLETIFHKQLTLVRPHLWDDPFENALFKIVRMQDRGGNQISLEALRKCLYGQCWTLESESDSLWKIYSPNKTGVRAKTTVGKLLSALWSVRDKFSHTCYFIGKVAYHPKLTLIEMIKDKAELILDDKYRAQVKSLLCKPESFWYEKEVRLLYHAIPEPPEDVFHFQIDPNVLFETSCFDPRMDKAMVSVFKTVLKKVGFRNPISQSTLYKLPEIKFHVTFPRAK
jgi:hypothetical protein